MYSVSADTKSGRILSAPIDQKSIELHLKSQAVSNVELYSAKVRIQNKFQHCQKDPL